jgi:hypothetical protein
MKKKLVVALGMAMSLTMAQGAMSQAPTCADIDWAANVLAANPDIRDTCKGVYEKDGKLYAKATLEVVRVRGNTVTFRPQHTDGTLGDARTVTVPSGWRADIAGRNYRASDLMRGQELNIYIPEDRWALHVADDDGIDDYEEALVIEEAAAVEMPTTASPLFLLGLAGGSFLALGGVLTGLRRRA